MASQVSTASDQDSLKAANSCRPYCKGNAYHLTVSPLLRVLLLSSVLQQGDSSAAQLHEAFDLLGEQSDFQVQLDGYAVLSNSPLTLFRDGDTVTITSKAQQQSLPLTRDAKPEGSKRKRPEAPLALTASGKLIR